jgi:hypothetical protein
MVKLALRYVRYSLSMLAGCVARNDKGKNWA